jgi:hypothetical protein
MPWYSITRGCILCYSSVHCMAMHHPAPPPPQHSNDAFTLKLSKWLGSLASQPLTHLTTPPPVGVESIPESQPDSDLGRRQSYTAIMLNRLLVHLTSHPSSTPQWLCHHYRQSLISRIIPMARSIMHTNLRVENRLCMKEDCLRSACLSIIKYGRMQNTLILDAAFIR